MGTFVTIHVVGHVVGHEGDPGQTVQREKAVDRAFEWFCRVEECCTRFEPNSEVMLLANQVGDAKVLAECVDAARQIPS